MWFDLSGLTPDAWMKQRADRWYQTLMIRQAVNEGRERAQAEAASYSTLAKARAGQVG